MSLPIRRSAPVTKIDALRTAVDTWDTWHAAHGDQQVLTLAELLDRPIPPELVDDLLVDGSVVTLVSAPGVGKSFLALDLALSIATGKTTFLNRPLRIDGPSPAFYVLGEGAGRFNLRVKAWQQFHGIPGAGFEFHTQTEPVDLLDQKAVNKLKERIRIHGPRLVVLDTLSRCISGHDENTQSVMSDVVEALYDLKADLPYCTVLPIHHLNASGTRERGSSVLRAGVDTQMLLRPRGDKTDAGDGDDEMDNNTSKLPIVKRSNYLRLSTNGPIGKQKDLEETARPLLLTKQEVPLVNPNGKPITDRYGKPLTSLVLVTADQEHRARIIAYTGHNPSASRRDVYKAIGGNQEANRRVLDELGFKVPSKVM